MSEIYDEWLVILQDRLAEFEEEGDDLGIVISLISIASIYQIRSEDEKALTHYQRSLALSREINYTQGVLYTLTGLGQLYLSEGDFEQSLIYHEQSLTLSKELGDKNDIATCLTQIGVWNMLKGELEQALSIFQRSETLYKELNHEAELNHLRRYKGFIYMYKGELEQAQKYFQQSLTYFENFGNDRYVSFSLASIGELFLQKGEYDKALSCFKQSLTFEESMGHNFRVSKILFFLISIGLEMNDIDLATDFFHQLQEINEIKEDKQINIQCRIAQALLLKTSPRLIKKSRAQEIFQQIVEEESTDYRLTLFAMLNLCTLLLDELKLYGEKEVISQFESLLTKIIDLSFQQQSYQLTVQTLLLQARFSMIDGDFEITEELLKQAKVITEQKRLTKFQLQITREQQNLKNELDRWRKLIQKNSPIEQRIESANLEEYVSDASSHFSPFTFSYFMQEGDL